MSGVARGCAIFGRGCAQIYTDRYLLNSHINKLKALRIRRLSFRPTPHTRRHTDHDTDVTDHDGQVARRDGDVDGPVAARANLAASIEVIGMLACATLRLAPGASAD